MIKGVGKRAQVTIFIIIAIVVVVAGVLIFFLVPGVKESLGVGEIKNPNIFIQNCLKEEVQNNLNLILSQGGEMEPGHYVLHNGEKISYACYTEDYYAPCVVQKPLFKKMIEKELKESLSSGAESCFDSLVEKYESKGYVVNLKRKNDFKVEFLPKKVSVLFDYPLVLSKEGTERFDKFEISFTGNFYEMIGIANSIIEWEATYGDSETTAYMNNYRKTKVEKLKQTDGTTIYILTDREGGDKLQFASRSVVFPAGYPNLGRGV